MADQRLIATICVMTAVYFFALAVVAPAAPILWLDANDIDGDGISSNDPADNSNVAIWVDKSGYGYDFTQGNDALRPTFKTNVLDSKPVVRFTEANDDALRRSDAIGIFGNLDLTVFAVVMSTSTDINLTRVWQVGANSANGNKAIGGFVDSSFRYNGGNKLFAGAAFGGSVHGIAAWRTADPGETPDYTTGDFWKNGAVATSTGGSTSGQVNVPASNNEFWLGRYRETNNSTPNGLDGDIAELILFDEHLSDNDVNDINAYLGDKWGIASSGGGNAAAGAALVNVTVPSYVTTVMNAAPVAYYRFEEAAGSGIVRDFSGNGHHSVSVDANVVLGGSGRIGNAVEFNGNGFIELDLALNPADPEGDGTGSGNNDFSIEMLVNMSTIAERQTMVAQQDGSGAGRSLVRTHETLENFSTFIGGSDNPTSTAPEADTWYHLVLTYDGDGGTDAIRWYVDGVAAGIGTETAEAATGNWILGALKSKTSQFMDGYLDELAIYDYRLDDPNGDNNMIDSLVPSHVTAIPEPSTVSLVALGLLSLIGFGRRRKR
jgi:hypothetical protein